MSGALQAVLTSLQRTKPWGHERECCIALHDFVRDQIRFGFTAGFEGVTPDQTLAGRRGHCNAQADLFRALLQGAGLPARLRFVQLDKRILRHALPQPVFLALPARLFHALTQVQVEGRWLHTDSYLFDLPTFHHQQARLARSGLTMGFGLSAGGGCSWDARQDAFSQAHASLLRTNDPIFPSLPAALAAGAGNNRLLGRHFNDWLALIPRPLQGSWERYLNGRLTPHLLPRD